jgi:hypothetical protein
VTRPCPAVWGLVADVEELGGQLAAGSGGMAHRGMSEEHRTPDSSAQPRMVAVCLAVAGLRVWEGLQV